MNMKEEKKAFGMSYEEFCQLYKECDGFNSEFYRNHPTLESGEKCIDFLKKGSSTLKENDMIKNILG